MVRRWPTSSCTSFDIAHCMLRHYASEAHLRHVWLRRRARPQPPIRGRNPRARRRDVRAGARADGGGRAQRGRQRRPACRLGRRTRRCGSRRQGPRAREASNGARPRLLDERGDVRRRDRPRDARPRRGAARLAVRRRALLQGPVLLQGGCGARHRRRRRPHTQHNRAGFREARRQSEVHAPGLCLLHVRKPRLRGDAQLHLRHRSDARQWPALRNPRVAPLRAHRARRHAVAPRHLPPEWSFDDGLCVEGEAGDAILFHIHTIHGRPPNRSTEARATFINRYLGCDDYQAFFATDVAMRRDARAAFERGAAEGRLPTKERGIVPCAAAASGRQRPRRGR